MSIVFTFIFSILNGVSVYLSIPLLDTLFHQSENAAKNSAVKENVNHVLPKFLTDIIDKISNAFHNYIFAGDTSEILLKICILILIAFVGKNVFGYLQNYYLAYIQQGMIKNIRDEAYVHMHKLPMSYFKNEKTGDLISRITNDVNVIQNSFSTVFFSFFREPITLFVFMIIAITISWKLFLLSLIIVPISAILIGWIGISLRRQTRVLQQQMGDITAVLQESISGVKIVKAFGMEKYENKKFIGFTKKYFKTVLRKVRVQNIASPSTELISVIVGVVIIFYGGSLVLVDKSMKASEFMGFLLVVFQMIPPMKTLASVNNKVQEAVAAGDRVFEVMDTEPKIKDIENPVILDGFHDHLEFKNVTFRYEDSDETILDDISLKVNKGEIIALVGGSGAGKTTFVDLIPRFYDPNSGEIIIDGHNIRDVSIESLRKLMGIVTQETVLFNESVRNNIAYGLENYPLEKIIEVSKIANAHSFIKDMSNGYETIIGEHGTKISGGQRQRISIARALLKNPPIMIFDEATSALDNESEMLVQEAIERLMTDRTTFVIAHRLSTIRNADRILVLDNGRIVQQGKHAELLDDEKGLYKKLYELQFRNLE